MNPRNYPMDEQAEKAYHANQGIGQIAGCLSGPEDPYPALRQRQIVEQFTYHSPSPSQLVKLNLIREAGKMLALTILANTPPGDEQSTAIANVRVATMMANASIVAGK